MTTKKDVQSQFGRSAKAYVSSDLHKLGKDLSLLLEIANIKGKEKLLDVATGGGHTANAFAPFVQEVTALDLTPEMLAVAKDFIESNGFQNVNFVEGDAEALPFAEDAFDIITCRIAPHHFPHIDQFITEVYRTLKPGGQFLLDDNIAPEDEKSDQFYNTIEKERDYSHFRAWKKTEWIQKLEAVGFNIEVFHRFEKTFEFDSWCERMQVTPATKEKLNTFILHVPDQLKQKFQIQMTDDRVLSFTGEAMVLKAIKA
ncbi:ubiquinone/menaquinone biosynthesis C-methylase UbiE [Pullulanibacillus pueri]|uniref:SAM-dependent methyltransferase n=1 Tax=Pullulanibacillus pueri TaxID=1437324 RepID=A0A8J3ELQ8_9BACL|nr:methyltransferase domain-containing protein [Pullulanibacillus pueri]MBM7681363.1 ubiquinone/menaquinone biosynthesis C-methylase UbiE [Pullulanibacillus pueri]GGH77447.1 SAM-dependent methyltransferase [Pullulanibacillus pueri]